MSGSYTDEKGRTRWHRNDEVGAMLTQLHDFLVIGGYPEQHAARYTRLAHTLSRWPECLDDVRAAGRLIDIDGVGPTVEGIIDDLLDHGVSDKMKGFAAESGTPMSVLELVQVPRLGPLTARVLYAEHGVDSLEALGQALDEGRLNGVKGMGPRMIATVREHLTAR